MADGLFKIRSHGRFSISSRRLFSLTFPTVVYSKKSRLPGLVLFYILIFKPILHFQEVYQWKIIV